MSVVTASVYAAGAAAFLALTLLSLTSWRGQHAGLRIIIASASSALWAAVLAQHAWTGLPLWLIYAAEIARDAAWIWVLTGIAGTSVPVLLSRCALGVSLALLLLTGAWPWLQRYDWLPQPNELLLARAGLVSMLLALVLLEQIFRNSNATARKSLRYFAFGVGGMFAADLFLYAQAELLKGIEATAWTARGAVDLLVVPLIALAVRRNPQWSLDIFVSRQVVFHTATFAAVGTYLLLMAVGGYYVRGVGGEWNGAAQLVYFSGAGAVLVGLLLSVSLRRRVRVFISKHFYRNKYDYRIEWLRFIKTLSANDGDAIERTAVRAVAQIFGSPAGVLFTRAEGARSLIPVACWPMSLDELAGLGDVPVQSEMAGLLERRQWIIDLQEYRRQPEAYDNLVLPAWIVESSELQIVAPILELERLTGFFLLFAPPPPFELTYEDRDLLKTVGRHVATALAQVSAARKLTEVRQFETYNRLTAFIMHDLKNLIAQLSLVVANAEKHKRNPEFIDDAIQTIANSVARMNRLMEQLQHGKDLEAERPVEVTAVVKRALTRCALRDPVPQLDAVEGYPRIIADPERLASVFEHVVRNAQDATPADGKVQVSVSCEGACLCVTVTDSGVGMESQFVRERLFRPFDTTKGAKGMGIGAYQAREYVRSLGGDIEVQSTPGQGTSVRLLLPVAVPTATETRPAGSEIQEPASRGEPTLLARQSSLD
jgi:putative PEP-CTERM system histidine kinase